MIKYIPFPQSNHAEREQFDEKLRVAVVAYLLTEAACEVHWDVTSIMYGVKQFGIELDLRLDRQRLHRILDGLKAKGTIEYSRAYTQRRCRLTSFWREVAKCSAGAEDGQPKDGPTASTR